MAKSSGNFITLQTLIDESISALSYRYWLLTSHYRSPVNFSFDAVRASQTALIRLLTTMSSYPDDGEIVQEYKDRFIEFINNDLDTAKALALVWDLIKEDKISPSDKKATLIDFDKVFGLGLDKIPSLKHEPIPEEIQALIDARDNARKDKDWAKADAMRQEIEERGFEVQDKNGKTIVIEK
jgi:cysteinyl-tRNA synthetase